MKRSGMGQAWFSRREFLKGLGASTALLPLLGTERAESQVGALPKRAIFVVTPNGVLQDLYWPTGDRDQWSFPVGTERVPGITAPLNEVKSELTVLKGIDMRSAADDSSVNGGHDNFPHLLTGGAGRPSIDQLLVSQLNPDTRFKSLTSAVMVQWGDLKQARISWSEGGGPVTPQENPYELFTDLFSAGVEIDPSQKEQLERLLVAKQSVLDVVGRDLERFAGRLDAADREQIQSHMEAIRDLERQFDPKFAANATCGVPVLDGDKLDVQSVPNYPAIGQLHMDLIVEAMACDLTRVATLQWSNAAANHLVFGWLGPEFLEGATLDGGGRPEFNDLHNHHEISHHGTDYGGALKSQVENWYHKQFLHLINKLASKKEGTGTMLDNTVVLWANHMHNGAAHSHGPHLPWLMAGRAGGLRTGQFLDWGDRPVPHNRVLVTLAQAMGATNVNQIGDARYNEGGVIQELFG